MSAALIVTKDKKQTNKAIVDKDVFTIGRSVKCDVVLDDDTISRKHAIIRWGDMGEYLLVDNGGRNGTVYKGRPILKELTLKDGDKFNIGPFELMFMSDDSDLPEGATRGIDEEKLRAIKEQAAAVKELPGNLAVKLVAETGPLKGTKFNNWNGDLTLGRHVDNDVVIPDDAMSNFHAVLRYGDDGYLIEDLGSANGSFVDGMRITEHPLANKARIRVGTSNFLFTFEDLVRKKIIRYAVMGGLVFMLLVMAIIKQVTPEPAWTPYWNMGREYYKAGKLEMAIEPLKRVLALKPDHAEAKKMLELSNRKLKVNGLRAVLKKRVEAEQFEKAVAVCDDILKLQPGDPDAMERKAVLKSLLEALQANESQQWATAIERLNKAQKFYANSEVLKTALGKAKVEAQNKGNYDSARRDVASGSLERINKGVRVLGQIPTSSFYYGVAQKLIDDTRGEQALQQAIADAFSAYQDARLDDALKLANAGKTTFPSEVKFGDLIQKIEKIRPKFNAVKAKSKEDLPVVIHERIKLAKEILALERDPNNQVYAYATKMLSADEQSLATKARSFIAKGAALERSGDLKRAAQQYQFALEAEPGNKIAATSYQKISDKVKVSVIDDFQQGLKLKFDLGEFARAKLLFERVKQASWPGHEYYDKANEQLKSMQ